MSRYHASDCANLKGEFDRSKGWDEERQIRLSKKLLEILGKNKPIGIVVGGQVDTYLRYMVSDTKTWREGLYYFSICAVMNEIAHAMAALFPHEKVSVYYDRGKFAGTAGRAFRSMMDDPRNADISKYLAAMAPMGWQDCVLLQPADLIAYEGMKRVDGSMRGHEIRKSLQALLGSNVDLAIGYFGDRWFQKLIEDKTKENWAITGRS